VIKLVVLPVVMSFSINYICRIFVGRWDKKSFEESSSKVFHYLALIISPFFSQDFEKKSCLGL
jgi:hypothetical protein